MRCLRTANSLLRRTAGTSKPLRAASSTVRIPATERCQLAPAFHAVRANYTPWCLPISRAFSHTSKCQKRKAGAGNNSNGSENQPHSAGSDGAAEQNPYDFADLTNAFERAEKHFTEELKKLRTGGRFNADTIGTIPVQLDKKSARTFPLRELATVAPLGGRRWSILAFEEESVKPIMSAVQRSDEFNQQPQRTEDNPLELTMTVEPERADALAKRAKLVCQSWRTRVRDEAHRRTEMHKKWKAERLVLNDDLHKLKKELQKLQDEAMKVILAKEKEAVQLIMAKAS